MEPVTLIFILLVAFQVKHFLADYPLQGKYMLGKFKGGTEWIKPLLAHVGVHAAFTFTIANATFLACGVNDFWLAVEIALFDAAVHFVMDRLKAGKKYLGRFKALSATEMAIAIARLGDPEQRERVARTYGQYNAADVEDSIKGNTYFWWSLGLDQMVHHLTHYAALYFILKTVQVIP